MNKKLLGWPLDKNVEEFSSLSQELITGRPNYYQKTAASAIMYLIARVKKAEETIDKMERNEEFNRAAEYDSLH